MKKIFYLSTCTACLRIIKELNLSSEFETQDIKSEPISEEQLDYLRELAGSYECLFSKRAIKYREWNLKEKQLDESQIKSYLLKEYTFLKRPVLVADDEIFIGNSKKTVTAAKSFLHG